MVNCFKVFGKKGGEQAHRRLDPGAWPGPRRRIRRDGLEPVECLLLSPELIHSLFPAAPAGWGWIRQETVDKAKAFIDGNG